MVSESESELFFSSALTVNVKFVGVREDFFISVGGLVRRYDAFSGFYSLTNITVISIDAVQSGSVA